VEQNMNQAIAQIESLGAVTTEVKRIRLETLK
jgi:hypothetical protein